MFIPIKKAFLPSFLVGFLNYFLLDIFFIYISNVIPFLSFLSKNPLSFPLSWYLNKSESITVEAAYEE